MAGETFQTDRVFVGIVILALAAIVLMWCLRRLELRFGALEAAASTIALGPVRPFN